MRKSAQEQMQRAAKHIWELLFIRDYAGIALLKHVDAKRWPRHLWKSSTGEVVGAILKPADPKTEALVNVHATRLSDSPEKFLMCCLRVYRIHLSDRSHLSERVLTDSLHTTSRNWRSQQFPACTPLREGGWGFVVTTLPVNKNKVKDNNNNNKLALRMLSAANKDRR